MIERTTVRLEQALLRAAKKKAAEEGRTLTSLIEDGLRAILKEPPANTPDLGDFKLPVSKARGGMRPGFDLADMSTIYEAEDEEYADRLRKGFK